MQSDNVYNKRLIEFVVFKALPKSTTQRFVRKCLENIFQNRWI